MSKKEVKVMGVTDIPCSEEAQDKLEIGKYVGGLEKFIKNCPTPMSIAIQGDWGTGKTSTINMLQKRLEKAEDMKCVYFNTWQYSQFNMADDLYASFVGALVQRCSSKDEKAREILRVVQRTVSKLLYNVVKDNTGLDIEELLRKQEERMASVESLKRHFAELIESNVGSDGRMVIFIDDLDRLNPEVAVELLEVIKLFMDVEKCVFILAIDYEVVVSGVRSKYGQNVSEEKCRNFFDKIIQLPFRLPVETYSLEKLVKETVEKDIAEDDIEILANFVGELLGANPRAYKRLANSYFLIRSVNDELGKDSDPQIDNPLIFSCLCIQMCMPQLYQLIVSASDEKELTDFIESLVKEEQTFLEENELKLDDKEDKKIYSYGKSFYEFLTGIRQHHEGGKSVYQNLIEVLKMTAITSVASDAGQKKRAASVKMNKLIINGMERTVGSPTDAIAEAYEVLLKDDTKLIAAYREQEKRILTDDESRSDSFFRSKRKFKNINMSIGVSSGTSEKMRYTVKLCRFLKERGYEAHVIWKDDDTVIFDSETYGSES